MSDGEQEPSRGQRRRNRSRGWCLTINVRGEGHGDVPSFPSSAYSISGRETASTGQKHWQCYVYYTDQVEFTSLKALHPTAHIEKARGTGRQNKAYCSKEGDFVETGELPRQGQRSDLVRMLELLGDGAKPWVVKDCFPGQWLRYQRNIGEYLNTREPKSIDEGVTVEIYWGDTGTGKTRKARTENPDFFELPFYEGKKLWFDGYTSQKTLLIDDYEPGDIDFRVLLKLLDRYTRQWPVKGGFITSHWTKIVMTADSNPRSWILDEKKKAQFLRRVTKIIHFALPLASA